MGLQTKEKVSYKNGCKRTKTITQIGIANILWYSSSLLRITFASVGFDKAACTGRGSSPVDVPFALRVPRPRCLQRGSISWK